MTSLFLLVLFIGVIYDCSWARKSKTRSTLEVIKELHEYQQEVEHLDGNRTRNGTPQWEPSLNPFSMADDGQFAFGVLPDPAKHRAAAKKPPPNRIIPLKPGEIRPPSGKIKLPKSYNGRDVWGAQCPSYNHVLYQGPCGNCWAVAIVAMINDRKCQYKKSYEKEFFHSAKHLTTCLQKGCGGGWFSAGLDYWIQQGIPSGGDYRMKQPPGCAPYPSQTGTMKSQTMMCDPSCDDGVPVTEKSFGGARYEIKSMSEVEIMAEIYLYGPVIATFDVYDDLAHFYTGGVYRRVSRKFLGGHACKLYGWGEENGIKFWYAANSWGKDWGDDGFFKIQRGINECNVESNIQAAVPLEGLGVSRRSLNV